MIRLTLRSRCLAIVCGAWFGCALAWAGELSAAAQKEITQLLDRIERSNCSFGRNGNWYPSGEARKHLEMKLDYMPAHACAPWPNATCRLGLRATSRRSGDANCAGSRLAAPTPSVTNAPAGN